MEEDKKNLSVEEDSNQDGIVDGSPESIKKLFEDIGDQLKDLGNQINDFLKNPLGGNDDNEKVEDVVVEEDTSEDSEEELNVSNTDDLFSDDELNVANTDVVANT